MCCDEEKKVMYRWDVMQRIAEERILAIVRARSREAAAEHARILVAAGLGVVEVSMTTPGALAVVGDLSEGPAVVGVGTVLDEVTAVEAARTGASFVVTPTLDVGVIRAAHRYGLATVVGCGSATEALTAVEHGADAVKLFPANAFSSAALRAILDPFPHVPLVPTGGIGWESAGDWLRAGAIAVGLGSTLLAGGAIETAARVRRLHTTIADLSSAAHVGRRGR
jgi:2-dehydro-3-deoxyphosphogluconate aldolase/(4S)-4-hydroxy-2-oxoglutarate aldolase